MKFKLFLPISAVITFVFFFAVFIKNVFATSLGTIASYTYSDNDKDGKIDSVTLTFSVPIDPDNSVFSEDNLTITNAGSFTGAQFGTNETNLFISDEHAPMSTLTIPLGTEASAVSTHASDAFSILQRDTANSTVVLTEATLE